MLLTPGQPVPASATVASLLHLLQIDTAAAVAAGVQDWAEAGNTSPIPASKLTNAPSGGAGLDQAAVDARVAAGVEDWAEEGNTEAIPASKLANAPQASASDALTLEVRGSVPAVAGFSDGDLINVNGDLYELVASGAATNVLTGIIAAKTSGIIGDDTLEIKAAGGRPNPVVVRLSQPALGSSPPGFILVKIQASNGFVSEDVLRYDSTHNTVAMPGRAPALYGFDGGTVDFSQGTDGVNVGDKYSLQVFRSNSSGDQLAALTVHEATSRWELEDRLHVAAAATWAREGNTDDVPTAKLPTVSGSQSGILMPAEYALIHSAVQGADLHSTSQLTAASLQDEDAVLLDDASVTVGSELKEISFSELDKRWRTQAVPSGNTLPAHPHVGDQFRLLADYAVAHDPLVQGQTPQPTLVEYRFPDAGNAGPQYLYGYTAGYGGSGHATLAGNVFLNYQGSLPADAKLIFYREGSDNRDEYEIADAFVPGFQHWYQVAGLSVGDIDDTGARFHLNLEWNSGADKTYADVTVDAGFLAFAGGSHGQAGWVPAPGIAAPWATQGQPNPRQLLALTRLIDGPGAGFAVSDAATAKFGVFHAFSPDFDLDDADKQQGEITTSIALRIETPGNASIGFNASDNSHTITQQTKVSIVFASDVREAAAYAANATNGVLAASFPVYQTISGSRQQTGTLTVYQVKATNTHNLGYYYHWDPESVAGGSNFNIASTLRSDFTHNDGAGTGLPDTTGRSVGDRLTLGTGLVPGWASVGPGAQPEQFGSFTMDLTTENVWVDTNIDLPEDADWIYIDWENDPDAGPVLASWLKPRNAFTNLTAQVVGGTVSASAGLGTRLFDGSQQNTSIWFGRTSANRILIAHKGSGRIDPSPVRFYKVNWTGKGAKGDKGDPGAAGATGAAGPAGALTPRESIFSASLGVTNIATGTTGIVVSIASGSQATGHGLSVANDRITFATAGAYFINWCLDIRMSTAPPPNSSGENRRSFVSAHWTRTRSAVSLVLKETMNDIYIRDQHNVPVGSRIGPASQHFSGSFVFMAQANDQLHLELGGAFIEKSDNQTARIEVLSTDSEISIDSLHA